MMARAFYVYQMSYLIFVGILLSLMISFPTARASNSTGLDVKSGVL